MVVNSETRTGNEPRRLAAGYPARHAHPHLPHSTLDTWPRALVVAVGQAYRQNGAEGTLEPAGWHRIRDAYLAAGGDPATVATTPDKIISTLYRVHPDWMHGPARRWLERNAQG